MRVKEPGEVRLIYVGDVALAYRGSRPRLDLACNSRVYQATKGWEFDILVDRRILE